ncbi:LysR family transcriptional regulator [Aldersonia sp. NBC_00410]|uniref:LysR family transcriptional regulator n=1 Tax=Aldersonia sp. NBC_00410 TaxID=2975954 RepID=UPI002259E942|nr:LysR family transcriptional regulator [Aldersonia sp. NBC_00410]MCX5046346.1 LysR family transcriptional regulator [Aldersonia sp. NBC_00410]
MAIDRGRYSELAVPDSAGPASRTLANLDLNLLVSLDALVQHQSVTRAAEQLGVTQPAVSAALRRLRRHFGDELLYRVGNRSQLTPLGIDLRRRTPVALEGIQRVFNSRPQFDIADTIREFSIVVSDYATTLLGEQISAALLGTAPHARIRLVPTTPDNVSRAEQVLTESDLMVVPHGFVTDLPHADLFRDEWAIVMDRRHPAADLGPTEDDLKNLPWVLVYHSLSASTPAARQLRMRGIEPHAQVITETFLTVPPLVANSNRISLIPSRMFEFFPATYGLVAHPSPVRLDPLVQAMWWNPIFEHEPEHKFLRDIVMRTCEELAKSSSARR